MKSLLLLTFFAFLLASPAASQPKRLHLTVPKMGSPFSIVAWHHDSAFASRQMQQAMLLADSLIMVFSNYDPDAETASINAEPAKKWISVSPAMMELLQLGKTVYILTHHQFDIAQGALTACWRRHRQRNAWPPADSVLHYKALGGINTIIFDTTNLRIKKQFAATAFDFGGIAKGYIAQQVLRKLQQRGIDTALVDAGGDIAIGQAPPGTNGWRIGVNMPQSEDTWPASLQLQQQGIATSGDMYQGILHHGQWYSHILNPFSGYGVQHRRNVTVIAAEATTADWLATSFSILTKKQIRRLAKKMNAEFYIAAAIRGKIRIFRSKGFPALHEAGE